MLCSIYMLSHLRNRLESSKGWNYNIRKENMPPEGSYSIHWDDFIQKGNYQKHASHEVPHLQGFFHTIH